MNEDESTATASKRLSVWLLVASILGLFGSSMLVLEKISFWQQKAEGTSPLLGCDLNPIVGCGPVINTAPASIFGDIPNPLIGVIAFAALLTVAVLLLAQVRLPNWFWMGLQAGVVFGIGIISYLQYESIFELGALCPYCMLVWLVMIPTFWLVTAHNLRNWAYEKAWASAIFNWTTLIISLHFILILALIWFQFGTNLWA